MRFNSEVRVMACTMETKRAYVAPTLNLLAVSGMSYLAGNGSGIYALS